MATRGTASMSITNFENMIMANLNIMVEDLSTMVEGPITLNIQGMVAGMSRVAAANTEFVYIIPQDSNNLPEQLFA